MSVNEISAHVIRWLAGDEWSFNHILKYYYRILIPNCNKMVHNYEDAEELVMNVLLKIWQNKQRFHEVANIDDYVYAMLRQEIILLSRKKVFQHLAIEEVALHDLGQTEHPELHYHELLKRYELALEKLTFKQREVFLSIREMGMNRKELAMKTGVSVHTINNHMNAALQVLRKELKEYPDVLVTCVFLSTATHYLIH